MERKNFFEKEAFIITILIFLPLLSYANFLGAFILPKGAHYSDYTISHFPNLLYLKTAFFDTHTIPLWNTQILSGFPNIANPLAGLWYPGNWLTILFPLPLGTHLITVFHLISGGIGMYLLLRQQKMTTFAAVFGGMAFELMPKLFAHYAAGHVSLVQAITWTPWILYLQQIRFGLSPKQPRYWYHVAILYGMVMLCDVRWVAYLFILDGLFFIKHLLNVSGRTIRDLFLDIGAWLAQVFIGLLLAAIFLIPFFEYLVGTDRNLLTAGDILSYSLPFAKIIGLIIPDMGGYAEYMVYPGLTIWVLFLAVLTLGHLRKKYALFYGFIGLCFVYSFGSSLPWMEWVANIPGINLLRVPSRMFFLVQFCFIYMAADYLSSINHPDDVKKEVNLLPQFFTLLFASAIMGAVIYSGDVLISDFYWPVFIAILLFVIFILKKYFKSMGMFFKFTLFIITLFDLTVVNSSQYDVIPKESVLGNDRNLYQALSSTEEVYSRVYSPSYRVEQHLAAYHHISLVDGIDPLHLSKYAQYMEEASGVQQLGYQVTIPAFHNGNPTRDNENAVIDAVKLGRLNTKFVVSYFPIDNDLLTLISSDPQTYVYENDAYLPRAWVENEGVVNTHRVTEIRVNPNRIELVAQGPGKLILSEIDYPGWKAKVNGKAVEIVEAYQILRSISLVDESCEVIFSYQPVSLMIGIILSGLTLFSIILVEIIHLFRRKKADE